jgi:hypothetical protein
MPSYAQLTACDPQAFIEAGQTYQRMAQGFARVRAAFGKGMAVLDANWQGAAKDIVTVAGCTSTVGWWPAGRRPTRPARCCSPSGTRW